MSPITAGGLRVPCLSGHFVRVGSTRSAARFERDRITGTLFMPTTLAAPRMSCRPVEELMKSEYR